MHNELLAHKSNHDCPCCESLEGLLENVEGAAFVVTKECWVQTLNREAEDVVRKADIVRITPDKRLAFNTPKNDENFKAAIAAVFDGPHVPPSPSFAIHYSLS